MHSIQCSVPFYTFVNAIKTDLLNEKNRIICYLSGGCGWLCAGSLECGWLCICGQCNEKNHESNATAKVQVGEQEMSIDGILIRMAQLNKRKAVLDDMRKRLPKTRVYGSSFGSSGSPPEYKYINYDLELIRQEYDRISNTIMEMQIALDRYNQTVLFEVDI